MLRIMDPDFLTCIMSGGIARSRSDSFASTKSFRRLLRADRRLGYVFGMDSTKLTDKQLADLNRIVSRQLNFLTRLQRRMEHLRFSPRDEIYLATMKAQDSIHELSVKLHYLSCKDGVGRLHKRD
jgi:hypothetical protein